MKLYRKTLLAVVALLSAVGCFSVQAQEETTSKPNVFIDYFWRPSNVSFNVAEQLRNYVIEGIRNTKRVDLIDVDSQDALKIEQARREEGVDSEGDADRLKVMSQSGANFLIQGRITSIVVEKKTTDDGGVYYTAVLNYTLKCINPNDGKLVHSQTFKYGGELLNLETSNTPDEAVVKACRSAVKAVVSFVDSSFPVFGKVLEAENVDKDKIKTCFISVGENAGVNVKDKFSINILREIAGRKSLKAIGELEVKAVEGEDLSVAEVKKGGKELKQALDAGQTVVIKSMVKKQGIFGGFRL